MLLILHMPVQKKAFLLVLCIKQWVNIEDVPHLLLGHAPTGNNVGLGLSFISDKIGPVTEQNVYGDFSYTLKLNDTHRLALGLKAGVSFHKVGLRDIQSSLPDPLKESLVKILTMLR
jgi:hypothetical protein